MAANTPNSTKTSPTNVSGWLGWSYFAAFMMMLAGVFQAIAGLVALFKQDFYVTTQNGLLVFSYNQWGWIHLLIGILLLAGSFSLFAGRLWGRILAVALASLSAVANFAFIQVYPLWSITVIVIDILIIYGVATHGSEASEV